MKAAKAQSLTDITLGTQTGANIGLSNTTGMRTYNFGITTQGGSQGFTLDSIGLYFQGNSKNSVGDVTINVYNGLGGTGTILTTAVLKANVMTGQYDPYDLVFGTPITLTTGLYSIGITTTSTSTYNYKSGALKLINMTTGATLTPVDYIQDTNSTGTAGTTITSAFNVLADPRLSASSIAYGNFRVGTSKTQVLSLSNIAFATANNVTEALQMTGVTGSGVTVTPGTVAALAQGANTSLTFTLDTSTVGAKSGSLTLGMASVKGTSASTTTGPTALTSQVVTYTGTGYRVAAPSYSTASVNLGNFRVGTGAQSTTVTVSNTAANDGFSEKLALASATPGGSATVGTLPGLISAGGSSPLTVGLSGISSAGVNSGTVTVAQNSDGTGTSGLSALALSNQVINVTATGYRTAAPVFSTTNLNLGSVRVGGAALAGSVTLSNSLASDGYSEKLTIVDAAASGGATANSVPPDLIAAGSNAVVSLGLNTFTVAGVKTGKVTFGLQSVGTGTSGLSPLTLASQDVNVSATVYRAAAYDAPDVDLGKYHIGATGIAGTVTVSNTVSSADAYSEKLAVTKNSVSGLTAGSVPAGLVAAGGNTSVSVNFSSVSAVGTNTASITFGMSSDGTGTSGLSALSLGTKTVNVTTTGYSGQSIWNLSTGGTWATFNNWDVPGGKPGVDGALSVDDRATFGAGPTGATSVTLDGVSPVLTQIAFNNASASYTIAKGTGNGSITLGTSSFTASVTNTAGSHAINADVALARNAAFSVASGTVLTMGGALNGTGALTKTGAGTLFVTGTGNLSGATTVSAGRLRVNGSIAGSAVTVQNSAILSGSGTVGATTIQSGGTLAPGNSPGNLTVTGNETWLGGGNYNWDLYNATGTAGTGWDLTTITGSLDLTALSPSSKFNINFNTLSSISPDVAGNALNFNPNVLYTWKIATAANGITGFSAANFNLNLSANNGANGFSNSIAGTYGNGSFSIVVDGNDLNILYIPASGGGGGFETPVPEPSTYGFAVAALALAMGAVHRRRKLAKARTA